jgi:hypothetical protein
MEQRRQSTLRNSVLVGAVGLGLAMLALAGLGSLFAVPRSYWTRVALVIAILFLILRQVMRRMNKKPRTVQPDPESVLKLND